MNDLVVFNQYYRDHIFNPYCDWIQPTYLSRDSWRPDENTIKYFLDVNKNDSIFYYKKYYPEQTDVQFIQAMGRQATEYYVYKNIKTRYVGLGCYRRYLLLDSYSDHILDRKTYYKIYKEPTFKNLKQLTSEDCKNYALEHLENYDCIINGFRDIGFKIKNQYIYWEGPKTWNLFIQAINKHFPYYDTNLFDTNTFANYEGTWIMKYDMYQEFMYQYFKIMEHIWENIDVTFPIPSQNINNPRPWRYPGFLNERFLTLFLLQNKYKYKEVPMILLDNRSNVFY